MLLKGELRTSAPYHQRNQSTHVVAWQWRQFLPAFNTQQQQAIIYAKSRLTEKYRLSSMANHIKPEFTE